MPIEMHGKFKSISKLKYIHGELSYAKIHFVDGRPDRARE